MRGHTRYLSQRGDINISVGNAQYGILCLQYLTSESFQTTDHHEISAYAKRGYFALHDYAVQCWYGHLLDWAEPPEPEDPSVAQTLGRLGGRFLQSHGLVSRVGDEEEVMTPKELRAAIHALEEDEKEQNSWVDIEARTLAIRQCIESLRDERLTSEAKEILDNLYGPWNTYKCSKPWCASFTVGMETPEERQKHNARHELPFRCHYEDCFAYSLGFDDPSKLSQHKSRYHQAPDEPIVFPSLCRKIPRTLHEAAKKGSIGMVTAILDIGVDIDEVESWKGKGRIPDHAGCTALYFAAKGGHIEVCKLLISRGASCNNMRSGALDVAVNMGNLELLIVLLARLKTQEQHSVRYTAISIAIQNRDEASLKALLQYGHIEAQSGHLDLAIRNGDEAILKALLKYGDIEAHEEHLNLAIQHGDEAILKALLRHPNIQLLDSQLKQCRNIAQKKGFGSIVAIIDGIKGLQRKLTPEMFHRSGAGSS